VVPLEWTWLFFFALLLFIEASTFNFITIWFAVGALGAFVTTYFTDDVLIQGIVFTCVTAISLILTRPLVKRLFRGHIHIKTNLDAVIGTFGVVDVEIKAHGLGRVNALGKNWAATSDRTIKVGTKVEILDLQGVKLIVKKKEEN
jgi:membrane protein implicated in regulation of membrane protease activity